MVRPIRDSGKIVGCAQDGVFIKKVRRSRHLLRVPKPSWAFGEQSIAEAKAAGCSRIQVCEQESGTVYEASIKRVERDGFAFDRGYGPQVALPLECWTKLGEPQQALRL